MYALDRRKLIALSLAAPIVLSGSAEARTSDAVEAYIRGEMARLRIPGLALSIIRHGRIERISTFGVANLEFDIPVTPTTLFSVASISKVFTSVGVMSLVEAGRLKLDEPIGTYLDGLPQNWRGIPILRLLNHTSGLPDILVDQQHVNTIADTPAEAIKLLKDRPMDFATGSEWRYNQTNYMLLQVLIEKLSGQSFVDFCQAHVFAPAKLKNAVFGGDIVIKHRANMYIAFKIGSDSVEKLDRPKAYNMEDVPMIYSAGGLNISISDFSRWLVALLGGKLITRKSLEALWTPAKLNDGSIYEESGQGWWLTPKATPPAVGGYGGSRSVFHIYPSEDLSVVVLTNLLGSEPKALAHGIAERVLSADRSQF